MQLATVEIFKTNVWSSDQAKKLVEQLLDHFPGHRINFDLHDRDKILRVEGGTIQPQVIIELINTHGYHCEILQG